MVLHPFLTFSLSLSLEQGQAGCLVDKDRLDAVRTESLLTTDVPDINIRRRQGLGNGKFLRKPVAAAQLSMGFIIHVQLLDGVDRVVSVKLRTSENTGPAVLNINLR